MTKHTFKLQHGSVLYEFPPRRVSKEVLVPLVCSGWVSLQMIPWHKPRAIKRWVFSLYWRKWITKIILKQCVCTHFASGGWKEFISVLPPPVIKCPNTSKIPFTSVQPDRLSTAASLSQWEKKRLLRQQLGGRDLGSRCRTLVESWRSKSPIKTRTRQRGLFECMFWVGVKECMCYASICVSIQAGA